MVVHANLEEESPFLFQVNLYSMVGFFEQLFLIVAVCPVLISAGSETIARGWELV